MHTQEVGLCIKKNVDFPHLNGASYHAHTEYVKWADALYRVAPKKGTVDVLGLCSGQQLSSFTLLDRASFLHYNNTKIIKFG